MFSITLKPYKLSELNIPLENKPFEFSFETIEKSLQNKVYSDKTYDISFNCDYSSIKDVDLFINGFRVDCTYSNGDFILKDKRLFIDSFGFVQISVNLVFIDENSINLSTPFLSVMIKDSSISQSLRLMAEYVYDNQEKLLFDNTMKSLDKSALKTSEKQTLESQISLIKEIIYTYRRSYKFFKINSKFKLENQTTIDKYENLDYVDDKTINFIVTHPEELVEIDDSIGITYDNNSFIPKNTMVQNNKASYDVYENRVIVSFIYTLIDDVSKLVKEISRRINSFSEENVHEEEYWASAYQIYGATKEKLTNAYTELKNCLNNLYELVRSYNNILNVKHINIVNVPKPTHVFLSTKHYFQIYHYIEAWFNYGLYDLRNNDFLVPFIANNQLYEYYILLKLYNYFEKEGYVLNRREKYIYRIPRAKYYRNTLYCNSFYFSKNELNVAIYYQPVLFLKKSPYSNNINIIRNTKTSMTQRYEQKELEGTYYLPDYIIKFTKDDNEKYLILDAKFSNQRNVLSYYLPNLVFKYIFSLSTTESKSEIIGICAINGKNSPNSCESRTVYTSEIPSDYTPFADILTIVENGNESTEKTIVKHKEMLHRYFSKIISLL